MGVRGANMPSYRRGLLLFIDEAEAFLGQRGPGSQDPGKYIRFIYNRIVRFDGSST